ncbi:MAG: YeeE/YedE family protein [Saprospiraceae bacterium]|nr:YeeE/YedE family protein [Saprospiraceae bacterium]
MNILDFISQPWHWSVSGLGIAIVMLLLLILGGRFGVSSSFSALCSIAGAGRKIAYFNSDWRKRSWLLLFVGGSMIGAYIASHFMASDAPVQIAQSTINDLAQIGVIAPQQLSEGAGFMPNEIFGLDHLGSTRTLVFVIVGGLLIGFGTRWAGGCTSGHAISGLANLQLPSLVAVIGFFIGGLLMTHLFFPFLFNL